MSIKMVIEGAKQLVPGIWEAPLPPEDVRRLGSAQVSIGNTTVLLLRGAEYNSSIGTISVAHDAIHVANLGADSRTIVVDLGAREASRSSGSHTARTQSFSSESSQKAGDRTFLEALGELPEELRKAGQQILQAVRVRYPIGELRKVQDRRFQETPDNFWFVIVQPRDQSLRIIVRGTPDTFRAPNLDIREDRHPYSRFKVTSFAQASEAISVILAARRK